MIRRLLALVLFIVATTTLNAASEIVIAIRYLQAEGESHLRRGPDLAIEGGAQDGRGRPPFEPARRYVIGAEAIGAGGPAGGAAAGAGGFPGGTAGSVFPGSPGAAGVSGVGVGGGLDLIPGGTVVIDDTAINGNPASTHDNDVSGTFST